MIKYIPKVDLVDGILHFDSCTSKYFSFSSEENLENLVLSFTERTFFDGSVRVLFEGTASIEIAWEKTKINGVVVPVFFRHGAPEDPSGMSIMVVSPTRDALAISMITDFQEIKDAD